MMRTFFLQLTLTDLTGEDAGDYSCLLLTVESGEVDKGTGSVSLQVIFQYVLMPVARMMMVTVEVNLMPYILYLQIS